MTQEEIRVRGTVQGVGFRPTVYRLAKACQLTGEVCNDGEGVLIRVSGSAKAIQQFIHSLQEECPPLAKIESIVSQPYFGPLNSDEFVITSSINNAVHTAITPDAATCPRCQEETLNPSYRWYRYPFTNCTHCGPRLSIVRGIPYDRKNTSMAKFALCPECAKEYETVEDRRFHAQPVACHVCGPKAWLEDRDRQPIATSLLSDLDEIDAACTLLQKGFIVAIKGMGGIHLACDATNEAAVQTLRHRKQRYHKPFALMARDIEVIQKYCILSLKERELLASPMAPIVLLEVGWGKEEVKEKDAINRISTRGALPIAPSVAPGQKTLGFMLPYTPLHHLLLQRTNCPIVLTSGNLSDEPQCIDNEEARTKLGQIADYFLLHNRDIVNRVDDSVVRAIGDKVQVIRRARGMAPSPLRLPPGFETVPQILAMGSELKNTFCLLRDGEAILSQHLGDLENAVAFQAYRDTLNLYLQLFEHKPEAIALDLHPEYLSSKLGRELVAANSLKSIQVQHHHAHIAACMAENQIPLNSPPLLGIALDGLGYGEDGTLWGGEFLLADYRGFQRLAQFKPIAMLGGEQAIYQPWRNTYAHLIAAFDWSELRQRYGDLDLIQFLEGKPLKLMNQMIEKGINSPLASSVGRLFDAVAAAIDLCRDGCGYEGQAAIEMEAKIETDSLRNDKEKECYPFEIGTLKNQDLDEKDGTKLSTFYLEPKPMWEALLSDLKEEISRSEIAAKFHRGLADAIAAMVSQLSQQIAIREVVLTGGVFQNSILLQLVSYRLQKMGLVVFTHSLVPANDGGLSLGQAVITAAKLIQETAIDRQDYLSKKNH